MHTEILFITQKTTSQQQMMSETVELLNEMPEPPLAGQQELLMAIV